MKPPPPPGPGNAVVGRGEEVWGGLTPHGATHLVAQQQDHHVPLGVLVNLSEPGLRER